MKVLMVGHYRFGSYLRGAILQKGLEKNDVKTEVCLGRGLLKYPRIALRILKNDFDHVLATGTLTFFVSRLFSRKPVIFDAFISNYDTLVFDRKLVKKNSLKARLLWHADKYSCKLADKAVFDTREHKDYFTNEFGLNPGKFHVIAVGADDAIFHPADDTARTGTFTVLFYGNFIPLHGVEYIIKAAKLLEKEDMRFRFLGSGQTLPENRELAERLNLRNVEFSDERVDDDPQRLIGGADVCLGIFGDTDKAGRVIPTKAFQIIAMRKPLVTGDSKASRRMFKDKVDAVLCRMADPEALAQALLMLKNDARLREEIASNGYALYGENYTPTVLGNQLKALLASI
ncbi:MAG: glycosyltransferase [Candidatus Altiarchaeota archaeon]|nr:glycosyltransferase [Candidatus Altiarchaeota archaeon]